MNEDVEILRKIMALVGGTPEPKDRIDEDDQYSSIYDTFGGNIDDAYAGGYEDGRQDLAYEIKMILLGMERQTN